MARTARALRLEAEKLRQLGWTYAAIAKDWSPRYAVNPRVALRLAHGMTQSQVADRWNELWPEANPKTAKHISYWEIWPDTAGRAPSLETLNRLALIYQCSAGDLLGGEDYTHLDPAANTRKDEPVARRSSSIQILTVSIAVVVDNENTLLVCRRDDGGGSWQFPAGVVKPGRDPATAAVRETLAETGIHCSVIGHVGRRLHPVTQVMCEYYHCDFLSGTAENLDPVENVSVTWVERARLTRFIPAESIFVPVLRLPVTSRPAIVAAIIVNDGRVLMVRRRIHEGELSWQFPAGELEPGETPYGAAIRETAEEVDLKVRPTSIIGEREHPATGRHMIYVACTVESGSTASLIDEDELDAMEWCSWSLLQDIVPSGLFGPVAKHLRTVLVG